MERAPLSSPNPPPGPFSEEAAPARILIVEDEAVIALNIAGILEAAGYEVVDVATNAEAALAAATREAPDLVLMDIRIRGNLDGIETAALLRERLAIPIVFLTAHADAQTLDRALATAPGGYVTKPFSEGTLRATIEVALRASTADRGMRRQLAELREQSLVDPLTGLHNRRHFDAVFSRELELARRESHAVGVILVDVDHFKSVNDRFGHAAGDQVLRDLARLLRGRMRTYDLVCRYGGEEIAIVVPGAGLANAAAIAEQLRQGIEALPFGGAMAGVTVTASFGVAAFPEHGRDAEALLVAADAALYRGKRDGRNRVETAEAPPRRERTTTLRNLRDPLS